MTLDKILEEINKANSIVILTHENPDGDAIGSSLAMYNILKAYGKNPDVIIPEYSKIFEFLPGTKEIKKRKSSTKIRFSNIIRLPNYREIKWICKLL